MSEVIEHEARAIVLTEPSALAVLLRNPEALKDYPIETVERLFAMDREMRADAAKREFAAAMNRVKGEIAPVLQRGKNADNHSTFAKLEDVQRMLDPVLQGEGFSYSFSTIDCPIADWLRIVMKIRHTSGHEEEHQIDAPIDNVGPKGGATKTKLHGVGSTYTYVERILLCKVFGLQTYRDDDGQGGNAGPGAKPIAEKQAADLLALLTKVAADKARFLKFFRIEKVEELPVSRYREAMTMLEAKRK